MAINTTLLTLISSIQQNFIDPNTRTPAIGTAYFYRAGTQVPKAVYIRTDSANNTYQGITEIVLDASGSFPHPIYAYTYSEDNESVYESYDLILKNSMDTEIFRVNEWPPVPNIDRLSERISDYIVNGQFNYPIKFYNENGEPNQVKINPTTVAPGWIFDTDGDLSTYKKYIKFEEIINSTEINLPKYLCIVDGRIIDATETKSQLKQVLGPAEILAGSPFSFSFFAQDRAASGTVLRVILQRNYGDISAGASSPDNYEMGTFILDSSLSRYDGFFNIPSLEGKTIISAEKAATSLVFIFAFPSGSSYEMAFTSIASRNVVGEIPSFEERPNFESVSDAFGNSLNLQNIDTSFNGAVYTYLNGFTQLDKKTGEFVKISKKSLKQNMFPLKDTRQELSVTGSNPYNVPYRPLYDVIGASWGSTSNLHVNADAGALIVFTALVDGDPANGYENGYSGGTSGFEKIINVRSYKTTVHSALSSTNPNVISFNSLTSPGTFNSTEGVRGNFTYGFTYESSSGDPISANVIQTMVSTYRAVETNTVTVSKKVVAQGSNLITSLIDSTIGNNWSTTITFRDAAPNEFQSAVVSADEIFTFSKNVIGFGSNSYNLGAVEISQGVSATQPNTMFIYFTVDGAGSFFNANLNKSVILPVSLKSTDTMQDITQKIATAVNNPFQISFKVGAIPTASSYFKFSEPGTTGTQYFIWYRVGSSGTPPTFPGETGIEVFINPDDSLETVATKTVNAIPKTFFNVPSKADIGMSQTGPDALHNDVIVYL